MKKRILLIQPVYPYGKKQVYLGSSLLVTAARLIEVGFEVELIDFNLPHKKLSNTEFDYFGITVTGAPYIPSVVDFINKFTLQELLSAGRQLLSGSVRSTPKILVGGQPISHLDKDMFQNLFGAETIQIKNDADLAEALGIERSKLISPYEVSLKKALKLIPDEEMKVYLKNEMTLFISQGCHFQCAFCAAAKGMREQFRSIDAFKTDLEYLVQKAKSFGYQRLEFYATNLDFFQNPKKMLEYLKVVHTIQEEYGIIIRIRCLACMISFLKAHHETPELRLQCEQGGLWSIGFGVDGTDPNVWKAQKKTQNHLEDVGVCLRVCQEYGIQAEILMIMGFPQDTVKSLSLNLVSAFQIVLRYKHAVLRPYLAKQYVPGNDNWQGFENKHLFVQDPSLFYNIDFCMAGSKFTHPKFWHRLYSNFVYLTICGVFAPMDKCMTYPLFPFNQNRLWNRFAGWWNRVMPFDR